MSYILDALKRSQQQRELGRVPDLTSLTFDEPDAAPGPRLWVWIAIALAGAAALLALYAALWAGAPAPVVPPAAMPQAEVGPPAAQAAASADPKSEPGSAAPVETEPAAPAPAPPLQVSDPDDLSVEPQVLVVPAPPKPGQRLPRGADELRRAVLGPEASPSVSVAAPPPPPPPTHREPERTPIPEDLIADIEAFKQQVGAGAKPSAQTKPAPPEPEEDKNGLLDTVLPPVSPPSAALRRRLPEFTMSVHVYDVDPGRRFVYINGRKLRERQSSREGLRVEQVRADGAVLSFDGELFFQRR